MNAVNVARAAWGGGDSRDLRSRLLRIAGFGPELARVVQREVQSSRAARRADEECWGTPAPGFRTDGSGMLWSVGSNGYSWSSTESGTRARYLDFGTGGISPQASTYRAYGLQLRCLQG